MGVRFRLGLEVGLGVLATATTSPWEPVPSANSPLAGDRNQQCPLLVRIGNSWRCLEILSLPSERARAEVLLQGAEKCHNLESGLGAGILQSNQLLRAAATPKY